MQHTHGPMSPRLYPSRPLLCSRLALRCFKQLLICDRSWRKKKLLGATCRYMGYVGVGGVRCTGATQAMCRRHGYSIVMSLWALTYCRSLGFFFYFPAPCSSDTLKCVFFQPGGKVFLIQECLLLFDI